MMTFAKQARMAMSSPGRGRRCWSAAAVVSVVRGSTTRRRRPRARASLMLRRGSVLGMPPASVMTGFVPISIAPSAEHGLRHRLPGLIDRVAVEAHGRADCVHPRSEKSPGGRIAAGAGALVERHRTGTVLGDDGRDPL